MRAAHLREAAAGLPHYERRRPEQTPLYRLVLRHYQTFAAEVERLPQFVKDEFEAYLACGILANLYRCRWQVELFFKWIKQHLRIKVFFGISLLKKFSPCQLTN